jgi:hypothetical protein
MNKNQEQELCPHKKGKEKEKFTSNRMNYPETRHE